jgi:hypothetical protein
VSCSKKTDHSALLRRRQQLAEIAAGSHSVVTVKRRTQYFPELFQLKYRDINKRTWGEGLREKDAEEDIWA